MASTYSNLKFELIGTGDQSGTWGTTTNTNLGTAIEQALVGMATISSGFVTNSLTLTLTDTNAAQNARALVLNLTQALSGAGTLNVPAIQKPYMIINATGQTVTVKVTGLTGVAVPNGTRAFLYNNGTDVGDFFNYASSLTLGTALPVASGGTGSSTACGARTNLGLGTIATQPASNVNISGGSITGITDLAVADGGTGASSAPVARTNLGATTVGGNLFTLTNPSAITFVRINADNTVSALPAACFRTAIGAGTGSGSVTSVSGTGTVQGLSLSGTVTGSGNITLGGSLSAVSLTTQVSGTLPVANGGTGAATFTANNVLLGNGTSAFQVVAAGTSGNVLTSNGTTWTSAAAAGGGANIQSFTATGTYTKPPGAKFVYVELWGGGGGGQAGSSLLNPPGGCTGGSAFGGGGGSGGGYTYRMFAAPVVGATETVTIGAGGSGGTAATAPCPLGPGGFGTNGGTTNFGTLLFAGGGTTCGGGAVVAGSLSYRQNIVAPGPGFAYTGSVAQIQIIGGPASSIPSTPLANLSQCYTKREIGGMWSGGGGGITRCPSSLVPSPGPFYPEVGKGRNSMFGAGGGGGGGSKGGGYCPSTTLTSGGTGGAGRIYGTNAASTSVSTGGSGGPSPGGAGSAGSCFNGGGGGASAAITPSITTAGAGGAGGAGGGGGGGGGGAVAPFTPPGTKRAGDGGAGGNGLAVVYTW